MSNNSLNSIRTIGSLNLFIFHLFSRVFLESIYVYILAERYAYMYFSNKFDLLRCILSWLIYLGSFYFVKELTKKDRFSDNVLMLLYYLAFLPQLILFVYTDTPFAGYLLVYWLMLAIINKALPCVVFKGRQCRLSKNGILFLVQGIVLVIVFVWVYYSKFHLQLSLFDVYGTRAISKSYNMPAVINYIYSMASGCLPTICVWSLSQKKYLYFFELIMAQYIIFCVGASKAAIFLLFVSIIGYYFFKKYAFTFIPVACGGIFFVSLFEKIFLHTTMLSDSVIRRTFFVPANLNYRYYAFFSENQKDYFMQSILGKLGFTSNYETSIQLLIGQKSGAYVNNGLFSDAYANLGYIGVIIMPVLIIGLLKLTEGFAKGLPLSITFAVTISTTIALISSSFFTIFLTHGVLANCIILYLLPRNADDKRMGIEPFQYKDKELLNE